MKKIFAAMMAAVMLLALTACGGAGGGEDFSQTLNGEFVTYHWYFNQKDGDSGFFPDDGRYEWVFNEDNTFSVNALDGSFSGEGTLEWTSANQADVYFKMSDTEQFWTAECSRGADYPDCINFMIQETNFVYVLEPAE